MKKHVNCLLFLFFCSVITSASGTAVIIQGNMFREDGQNFIRIVYGNDTIPVNNIQPFSGFPYFISAGFPTGEHMGGGPGFCLVESCAWNGVDDLFLELSFNKTPNDSWNFEQSVYRVNKQGDASLIFESVSYFELATAFGENILAAKALYSSDTVTGALVNVYSKDGLLLSSKEYSVNFKRGPADIGVSIFNDFRLRQIDTLLFNYEYIIDNYGTMVYDSSFVIVSQPASIKFGPQKRSIPINFSGQNLIFDAKGRRIVDVNRAFGPFFVKTPQGMIATMKPNRRR